MEVFRMKKFRIISLTFIPFLLVGCQKNAEPVDPNLLKKDVEVKMVSHFADNFGEDEYKDTWNYSDYWFLEDSSDINYDLAVVSAMTGAASYSNTIDRNGAKITNFLTDVGFTNIQTNQYYTQGKTLENSIGAIIGQKTIKDWYGKEYTLLAVFPRNAGYLSEWVGNFNIGKTGIHNGFLAARDEMLRFMKHYIISNEVTGDLKIWCAGYSRGAATINLLGGYLCEDSGYFGNNVKINKKDVYTYTIGTPRPMVENLTRAEVLSVSGARGEGYLDTDVPAYKYVGEGVINPTAEQYKGIHNFIASGDFVAKLPTAGLGFTRYGESVNVTYGDRAMMEYIVKLSPSTAEKFTDKNYTTVLPTKTVDLQKLTLVNGSGSESADQMLEKRFASLMGLANNSRETLAESGYTDALGALTAIVGTDMNGFVDGLTSDKLGIVKAAALSYFAYATEKQNVEAKQAVSNVIFDLMGLIGKPVENREAYTDQALLKDLFDYLINDYQTKEDAVARSTFIASLLPEPYNGLYTAVLEYAKQKQITVTYADDLLYLIASYANENKEDPTVKSVIETLAGMIPEQYVGFLSLITAKEYPDDQYPTAADKAKAGVTDILDICVNGSVIGPDYAYRNLILSMVPSMVLQVPSVVGDLLVNGSRGFDGEVVANDPVVLSTFVDEILKFITPKNEQGELLSIADAANQAICDLLANALSTSTEKYINQLKEHPELIRNILVTFLFNPGDSYSLASDIENAVTFIDTIQFLFPAHNHEMYISYLKTCANAAKPN